MPLTGFYVIAVGIVIAFLSFLVAAVNMGMAANGTGEGVFGRHLAAMVGMAVGGLVSLLGLLVGLAQAVEFYG